MNEMPIDMKVIAGIKKKRNVIIKMAKVEFCYHEYKFLRKEITDGECPFGLTEYDSTKCLHCRYVAETILNTSEEK